MLSKKCDRCDAELVFEQAQAGQKVECPHCGDVNVVPAGGTSAAATEPAAIQAGVAERAAGLEQEKVLMSLRPAMGRAHPIWFALLWAGMLGGAGAGIWLATDDQPEAAIAAAVVAAACVVILLGWKVMTLKLKLEVTNLRTIRTAGLLSRSTSEVLHENIRNFQIDQSLTDRLLNVGQIGISSSGQDEVEIVAGDVPRPYEMKKLIDGFREMK